MAMQTPIDAQRIVIIGMGSRGLSVLEQLIGAARLAPHQSLFIELFDPHSPGGGLHLPEQPDYLMLNTMAGQLSAFSAAHPAWQAGEVAGLTFLQWCTAQKLTLNERGHLSECREGRPIEFGDFVPRKLLGRYLQDCYGYLLRLCPPHVQVRHTRDTVTHCVAKPSGHGFVVNTDTGHSISADAVFLTTGHAPQPLARSDGNRIAIEGLGLSAMDHIAALTEGRGGRYERAAGISGWRYQRSGLEPQIYLFSRSGLPFHCRPQWQSTASTATASTAPERLFLTCEAMLALRKSTVGERLDFVRQVLPLIEDEMRAAFYLANVRLQAPGRLQQVRQGLRRAESAQARCTAFAVLANEWGSFDPQDYLNIQKWQGDPTHYSPWYRAWIADDLVRSRLGGEGSPLTQALEVWRDCRDVLRLAVAQNGLTERSTLEFYGVWAGLGNRLVGGPQKERYEDLLALIEAGVVVPLPPAGINHVQVDSLIRARNSHSGLSLNRSALIDNLLEQGLIKAAHPYPADGIAIDAKGRSTGRVDCVHQRLWVLGPAVEGSTFYNHYVPTPDPTCRAPLEARTAVIDCLSVLRCAVANVTLVQPASV